MPKEVILTFLDYKNSGDYDESQIEFLIEFLCDAYVIERTVFVEKVNRMFRKRKPLYYQN